MIFPTSIIKIIIGLWIFLPQYYVSSISRLRSCVISDQGEKFIFDLLSDKLERFELLMRRLRNSLSFFILKRVLSLAGRSLKLMKYIPRENLDYVREQLNRFDASVRVSRAPRSAPTLRFVERAGDPQEGGGEGGR